MNTNTLSNLQIEQGVMLIKDQIKSLIILKRASMDGNEQATNMAMALKTEIENIVSTFISTHVVVEETETPIVVEETKTPVVVEETVTPVVVEETETLDIEETETLDIEEEEEEEETSTYVPWVKPAHHKILSLNGMQRFDDNTGNRFGGMLEQRYCEWIDAGRPDIKNGVYSVDVKQDEVEDQDDIIKAECQKMINTLAYIQPIHSLELEIKYTKDLISEYEAILSF